MLAAVGGSTRATLVLFTTLGVAYTCRFIDVPASTGYGEPVQRLFKFKDEVSDFEAGKSKLEEQHRLLGPITLDEKKAMSIFLMTVLLWATEDYQEVWFNGFSISIYVTAVIAAICCMMPRIGLLTWKEAGI